MKVFIISLGCPKNSVDSEHLAGTLSGAGHVVVDDIEKAEVALVNTCGFIQPAVEESIDVILDLERMKDEGKLRRIGVVGCLVNRYGDNLKAEFSKVDIWADSEEWQSVLSQLGGGACGDRRILLPESSSWSRYLKISEGCNTRCTYCTIPSIRGSLRSLPVERIIAEAEELVSQGTKELCLVGQDLTVYGLDLYGRNSLVTLLDELERALPHDIWVRLFYLHPSRVDRKLIEHVCDSSIVVPYLDIPMQHVDEEILRMMNRPATEAHLRRIFQTARSMNPDFAFRTTIMVGFPGETEEKFEYLLNFLEEMKVDRLGAFTYSAEAGTPAASMPDQVPEKIKEARYDRLMEQQAEISREIQSSFVGKRLKVLIEEVDAEDGTRWGRSYRDAPEIDGVVGIYGAKDLAAGDFAEINITDSAEYDLFGEVDGLEV